MAIKPDFVFFVRRLGVGGHTRTAIRYARALHRSGFRSVIVTASAATHDLIAAGDVDQHHIAPGAAWAWRLASAIRRWRSDQTTLCCFERWDGLAETLQVAKNEGIGHTWVICGGPPPEPWECPRGAGAVVALSREVADAIRKHGRYAKERVRLQERRMDLREVSARVKPARGTGPVDLVTRCGLPRAARIVLRIARLGPYYERSIREGALAVAKLRSAGVPAVFLHLGEVEDRGAAMRIGQLFAELNSGHDAPVAISIPEHSARALEVLPMASVVVGAGDSAMEALLLGKAVVIVGSNGFAGALATAAECERALSWNFAGRQIRAPLSEERSVDQLAAAVRDMLDGSRGDGGRMGDIVRWAHSRIVIDGYEEELATCLRSPAEDVHPHPWDLAVLHAAGAARRWRLRHRLRLLLRRQ